LIERINFERNDCKQVETLLISDEGWELAAETKQGIKTYLKEVADKNITLVTMKGCCEVNAPPQNIIACMNETDLYSDWVPLVKDAETLLEMNPFSNLYTVRFDFPLPISLIMTNRDVVFHGYVADCLDHKDSESVLVVTRDLNQTERDRYKAQYNFEEPPAPKKYLRVSLRNGGMVLKPLSANKTMCYCVLDIDPCISLPNTIVNLITKKFSVIFFEKLKAKSEKLEPVYEERINKNPLYMKVRDRVNKKFEAEK